MSLTGNKGEWSEIYTFLKIIAERRIYSGDKFLKEIGTSLPVVMVSREEKDGKVEFRYFEDTVIIKFKESEMFVSISEFVKYADYLLKKLREKTTTTFSIPEIEVFLNSIKIYSLKAKSSQKSDIEITVNNERTGSEHRFGFSIKSRLGGASTLLNAGKTTNFIYRIIGSLEEAEMIQINSIDTLSKIKDRMTELKLKGCILKFNTLESKMFQNRLILIDSSLPQILAEALLLFFGSGHNKLSSLVDSLVYSNPLNFDTTSNHPFYEYKVKRFLTDIALGMTPFNVWTGELDATGGYLIVRNDGTILCYHSYNRNEFEDYLLANTKLETASSSRHNFGSLYREGQNLFLKLNLQIRFFK